VKSDDVAVALRTQGVNPLTDTMCMPYAASPVWERSNPDAIVDYILHLAARKGASDVQIEPKEDAVSVKYRIDGFFFRVDPTPKPFQPALTQKMLELFKLDPRSERRPQKNRITLRVHEDRTPVW